MEYSKKYSAIEPSITLAISAKEKKMKSEGNDERNNDDKIRANLPVF